MKGKFLFAAIIVLCMSITIVYAALQVQKAINAYGNIKSLNVQVYQDSACTVALTQIDWGILSPGQTKTVTCYVKSISTVNATLSMTTGSWNPSSAASYINLSWNRASYKIAPAEVVSATFTLAVSQSITDVSSFSFTITVTATEA